MLMQNGLPNNSRFRVVFLLQDLLFGGTQRHTLELARRLNPTIFQPEIWLLKAGEDFVSLARHWDLSLTWLGRRGFVGPDSLFRLWWRLQRKPVDLLVLMTVIPNVWGRLLGRLAKVPLIVGTLRGIKGLDKNHEKWLWPLADHFLCNAAVLKRSMMERFQVPEDRITVIHNGVNLDYFRPSADAPASHRQVILCIARFVPEKDHETLIAAFSLVAARHPEAELWLLGEGPKHQAISRLINHHHLVHQVRFLPGQLDIAPLLQQSDILVLSSIQEGLPNVVLEAMAAGLPVVATDAGGLSEVVAHGETGWLVPQKDTVALADSLSQLLADEAVRVKFGHYGRKRAEDQFSVSAMVQRHEEVFLRLLHEYQRRSPART